MRCYFRVVVDDVVGLVKIGDVGNGGGDCDDIEWGCVYVCFCVCVDDNDDAVIGSVILCCMLLPPAIPTTATFPFVS